MKIENPVLSVEFMSDAEEGRLTVEQETLGEPYRQGVSFSVERPTLQESVRVFLETFEARAVRDLLLKMYPLTTPAVIPSAKLTTIADKIAAKAVVDDSETSGETAQYVRDLIVAFDLADAYTGAREDLGVWKARALAAEQEIRELPTLEMVILQVQKYDIATIDEVKASELADLKHMLASLPSDN
jgi:hypothetical protein